MKSFSKRIFTVLSLTVLGITGQATAKEVKATLILTVSGQVAAGPHWEDANGNKITSADLKFEAVTGDANQNVDSKAASVALTNPVGGVFPASITLVKPQDCKIGTEVVSNDHVQVLLGGEPIQGDKFDLPDGGVKEIQLRFSQDGSYGDKAGTVSCADGSMTHSAL